MNGGGRRLFWILLLSLAAGCGRLGQPSGVLRVAAPDYLKPILDRAAAQFYDENRLRVEVIPLSEDTLLEHIAADSSFDLFFASHPRHLDKRANRALMREGIFTCPFRLSLVVAVRQQEAGQPIPIDRETAGVLLDDTYRRVVINDPEKTYEGQLVHRVLDRLRLWKKLESKIIVARDTSHLGTFLTSGEADAAVVLESSLESYPEYATLLRFDRDLEEELTICGAVTATSQNKEAARAFLDLFDSRLCAIYRIRGVYQR